MMNNNFPFRGVLGGQMPGLPTFQSNPRTMFSQGGQMAPGQMQSLRNQFGNMGEMSFGNMFPGKFPADWGYVPPQVAGGPGKNMNNFPGVLSGGFNRRGL